MSSKSKTASNAFLSYAREDDIRALFELLGLVAKSDSVVDQTEIEVIQRFMNSQVPESLHSFAITCFKKGKELPLSRGIVTTRAFQLYGFRSDSGPDRWLEPLQVIDILIRVAFADGQFNPHESHVIEYARETLGIHPSAVQYLKDSVLQGSSGRVPPDQENGARARTAKHTKISRMEALERLKLDQTASIADIKKQYRMLVKRCHPDLVAGEKSSEDMRLLILRFHEIQEAYEALC